jgi:hypothetical protein
MTTSLGGIKENDLSINESFLLPQIQTNNNREQQQLILSPIFKQTTSNKKCRELLM